MIYFISNEDFDKVFSEADVDISFAKNKNVSIPILKKDKGIALIKYPENILRNPYDFYKEKEYISIKTSNTLLYVSNDNRLIDKFKKLVELDKMKQAEKLIKDDFLDRINKYIRKEHKNFSATPYEINMDADIDTFNNTWV